LRFGIVVGLWPALADQPDPSSSSSIALTTSEPNPNKIKDQIARCRDPWLLFGHGVDDSVLAQVWRSAATMRPAARLAMLGVHDDGRRCNRWLRRGCSVYLQEAIGRRDLEEILMLAAGLRVAIVAHEFIAARRSESFVSLSGRESDVLNLLCEGLQNSEIAAALYLTENTVEFHVRRLLLKLGARNRVQAAAFGINKGLV
jgi:DNA-binding NarL/FixJ family response regulator